ncbi:H/ACA ribonucleoprotein complex non-core subunit NAF1 [Armigeres subalbatus]|uniref:H/ACA ribonucleoprotein complex non-core subunit NAF1 n=1 Tax=Armigeres subalbatus TaxID=124917 RepID=UPI002ED2FB0A
MDNNCSERSESGTIDIDDNTRKTAGITECPVACENVEDLNQSVSDKTEQRESILTKNIEEPAPEGSSENTDCTKAQMDDTVVDMVCSDVDTVGSLVANEQPTEAVQISNPLTIPSSVEVQNVHTTIAESLTPSTIIKDEPTDAEMESAEDFTRRGSDFPTVPRITIKQEVSVSVQEQIAAERSIESRAVLQIKSSSLSLLSQYISSDSESNITDSDNDAPRNDAAASVTTNNNKRRVSSSSAESLSDDGVEIIPNTNNYRVQETPIIVSDAETTVTGIEESSEDELSGDEDGAPRRRAPIKSKGEVLINELPPIEDLQITVPETECKPIGHIQSIVAQIVIVQSYAGVELLNLETVLFLEKGKRTLGKIFDVIGQVTAPMYCVLFNSRNDVIRKGITIGMPVYCAPQTAHTSFIILSDLMRYKGSDASWLDDNEAPEHALDYSDDEQERRARRRRGSCSSNGRVSPETQYQPYHLPSYPSRRGRGVGGHRGRGRGHSWHNKYAASQQQQQTQPQRVLNPFAFGVGAAPPPPPPPPPQPGSGN